MELLEKVKALPALPGVYIYRDSDGQIIYVGKAKLLNKRVASYFNSSFKNEKTLALVSKIKNLEYIITPSESDALALECTLIKKHQPYYNILLKDGKQFAFIRFNLKEKYPRLEIARKTKKDGAKYFGPYLNGLAAMELIEIAKTAFKLRTCKLNLEGSKIYKRPCLNYDLERCNAPCVWRNENTYNEVIKNVTSFLNGKTAKVKAVLEDKMERLSASENFEEAILVRDRLKMLEKLTSKIVNISAKSISCDCFAYAFNERFGSVCQMAVRDGKVISVQNFSVINFNDENLESFMAQLYLNGGINTKKVLIPHKIGDALSNMLKENFDVNVNFKIPTATEEKQLFKEAQKNANEFLEKSIEQNVLNEAKTTGAVKLLQEALSLKNLPNRIECFDISHTFGTHTVASMAVFTGGIADKAEYRKFKIKTVKGISDYASMEEVLARRFTDFTLQKDNSFKKKPDLIIIDGGKGQLSSALKVLKGFLDFHSCDLIALAERINEVFLPYKQESILLPYSSFAHKLIVQVRDEAHRFAVSFHRNLKNKELRESQLDVVPSLGTAKKQALLKHFKSVNKIKEASITDLMQVKGIGENLAMEIKKYFKT